MRDALWPGSHDDHVAETAAFLREPDDRFATFVIERGDGRLGGFLEMGWRSRAEECHTTPVAYIEGWYVEPDLRRQGLGRDLVRAGEAWAAENGYREIASDSHPENDLGIRAHRALGFQEVARAVCFRKSLTEDA